MICFKRASESRGLHWVPGARTDGCAARNTPEIVAGMHSYRVFVSESFPAKARGSEALVPRLRGSRQKGRLGVLGSYSSSVLMNILCRASHERYYLGTRISVLFGEPFKSERNFRLFQWAINTQSASSTSRYVRPITALSTTVMSHSPPGAASPSSSSYHGDDPPTEWSTLTSTNTTSISAASRGRQLALSVSAETDTLGGTQRTEQTRPPNSTGSTTSMATLLTEPVFFDGAHRWRRTRGRSGQSDPFYTICDRNWCSTARSTEFDHVWQQLLSDRVHNGSVNGYEYAFEVSARPGLGYSHYHGTVFLKNPQQGLAFFKRIFAGTAYICRLRRGPLDEFRWRKYYRKDMDSQLWELNCEQVRDHYRAMGTNGVSIPFLARPARQEGNMMLMADIGQRALRASSTAS